MSGHLHLILGGARSGKSRHAEELARKHCGPVVYVATCATDQLDDEMQDRIAKHRSRRPPEWRLVENRFDLPHIVAENPGAGILLDCLTLWLAYRMEEGEDALLEELESAIRIARNQNATVWIVSNELGLGLVPMGEENRVFRDLCGRANQRVAMHADVVEMLVAGLPMRLKG